MTGIAVAATSLILSVLAWIGMTRIRAIRETRQGEVRELFRAFAAANRTYQASDARIAAFETEPNDLNLLFTGTRVQLLREDLYEHARQLQAVKALIGSPTQNIGGKIELVRHRDQLVQWFADVEQEIDTVLAGSHLRVTHWRDLTLPALWRHSSSCRT